MSIPNPLQVGLEAFRAHGLGNDYLVFEADADGGVPMAGAAVRATCDRTRGVGSDGIVVLLDRNPGDRTFPLRMFNPDGSEFERSGNGLRILGAFLHRIGRVGEGETFRVRSGGVEIPMTLHGSTDQGEFDLSVAMGGARTGLEAVDGRAEYLDDSLRAVHPDIGPVSFHPVSVGNPHVVVFTPELTTANRDRLGAFLSEHPAFARGTNVQLAQIEARDRVRIVIWERGVGPTEASGTSSCAAAVAAVDTGQIPPGQIEVLMPGGRLTVQVDAELDVTLRGPVQEIGWVRLAGGFARRLRALGD